MSRPGILLKDCIEPWAKGGYFGYIGFLGHVMPVG
jgi:hypothetical protein